MRAAETGLGGSPRPAPRPWTSSFQIGRRVCAVVCSPPSPPHPGGTNTDNSSRAPRAGWDRRDRDLLEKSQKTRGRQLPLHLKNTVLGQRKGRPRRRQQVAWPLGVRSTAEAQVWEGVDGPCLVRRGSGGLLLGGLCYLDWAARRPLSPPPPPSTAPVSSGRGDVDGPASEGRRCVFLHRARRLSRLQEENVSSLDDDARGRPRSFQSVSRPCICSASEPGL